MSLKAGETVEIEVTVKCKDCSDENPTEFTGKLQIEPDYQDIFGRWHWQVFDRTIDYPCDEYVAGRMLFHHTNQPRRSQHNSFSIFHIKSGKKLGECGFGRHTAVVGLLSPKRYNDKE